MIKDEQQQLCHPEVPEAQQYGSKHELSVMAKVKPEARQYGSKHELSVMAKVKPEARQYGSKHELLAVAKVKPEARQYGSKQAAFTLAEVLITLGVIGVVAAMTIPTLVKNYEKKVVETKLKQTYSILANAINMAKIENGDVSTWGIKYKAACNYTDPDCNYSMYYRDYAVEYSNYIIAHLKIDKLFTGGNSNPIRLSDLGYRAKDQTGCVVSYMSGGCYMFLDSTAGGQAVRLPNGVIIMFYVVNAQPIKMVVIDVNGVTPPNVIGRDLFYFYIDNKGQLRPLYDTSSSEISKTDCTLRCSTLIMKNDWKIDYNW